MKVTNSESDSAQEAYNALKEYLEVRNKVLEPVKMVIVDVGAGKPDSYSNSEYFRDKNSVVICIEPNPRFCEMFRSKGYDVLEYAATKEDVGELEFIEFPQDQGGLGGSALVQDCQVLEYHGGVQNGTIHNVKALSLNSILRTHHPDIDHIEILDIDTEGNELDVLRGLDLDKYKPKVMIIENLYPDINGYYDFYKDYLCDYTIVCKCAHNDILVRND